MNKARLIAGIRLFFGCLTLGAIAIQAWALAEAGVFNSINYLSYFTNLSNIFAAVVFIISAGFILKARRPSKSDDIIRGASVLYMAVTGVIYATLLTEVNVSLQIPWVNVLLHYVMPVVVVLDWLYRPQGSLLRLSQMLWWLVFPLIYLVYSLLRGAALNWYPYPFLNPQTIGGYGMVTLYCIGILGVFLVLGWLLMQAGNHLRKTSK
jgi:hypothetical protein